MPEGAPRLEDVRAAVEALQGSPVATLQDLLSALGDVNDNVQVSVGELQRIVTATEGALTIPEVEVPPEGQTTYPARYVYLLEQALARQTAISNIAAAVLLRLNGPDQTGAGVPTGIVSITDRLDAIGSGLTEVLDQTTFVGTRLTDIYNRMAVQQGQTLTVLGGISTLLSTLVGCACGGGGETEQPAPSCLPDTGARVVSWADGGTVETGGSVYNLWYPNFGPDLSAFNIALFADGSGERVLYRHSSTGSFGLTLGSSAPPLPAGSKLWVRNITLSSPPESSFDSWGSFAVEESEPPATPWCDAWLTSGVDPGGIAEGDVIVEFALAIPVGAGVGAYTSPNWFLAPGAGPS